MWCKNSEGWGFDKSLLVGFDSKLWRGFNKALIVSFMLSNLDKLYTPLRGPKIWGGCALVFCVVMVIICTGSVYLAGLITWSNLGSSNCTVTLLGRNSVRTLSGLCLNFVWTLSGIWLDFVWTWPWVCLDFVWPLSRFVWNLSKLSDVFVCNLSRLCLDLGCILLGLCWDLFGTYLRYNLDIIRV